MNSSNSEVCIPVSIAELIDKITILEIKLQHVQEIKKLANIEYEHKILIDALSDLNIKTDNIKEIKSKLFDVNKKIWDFEDKIREKVKRNEYDVEFIEITKTVHLTNDVRASIKKQINAMFNSKIIEEKSHID